MGTHPIFESDFDCLTEARKCQWRHPRAPMTVNHNCRVRGDPTGRCTQTTQICLAPLLTIGNRPKHKPWIRQQIKSWLSCLSAQFVTITSFLLLCSVLQVILYAEHVGQNYRAARLAVANLNGFAIWRWRKWRLQFTFLANIPQTAAQMHFYIKTKLNMKNNANFVRILALVQEHRVNGQEILTKLWITYSHNTSL